MIRACALSLSLVLSGCALNREPGSFYRQWRDGGAGERALLVVGGVCLVGLLYLVYHESAKDGDGGGGGSSSEPCIGECRSPEPRQCYMGQDQYGAPCW